jgi:hypothetical protein
MSRLVVEDDAALRLGGAVPSPAAAFLLAVLTLPALFWLVMLKRTTVYTAPEEWLMANVVPAVHAWVETNLPPLETLIIGTSALGSGWFVALAFAGLGLLALARGRRDLAALLALGTLCFPIEWMLKYFVSAEAISLPALVAAIFNVDDIGLDDIADFPAGHALRATALYGIAAFCVARLAHDVRQGQIAYVGSARPHRGDQRHPDLPRRALPDGRARRLDGRRGARGDPGRHPRPPRRREAAGPRGRGGGRPGGQRTAPGRRPAPLPERGDS